MKTAGYPDLMARKTAGDRQELERVRAAIDAARASMSQETK